jgi:putative DNA primase/helicase
MFARAVKGDVVVVDAKKGDCFIWNEKSALWDERPGIFCQNMIGYSLNPIFDAMLEFLHCDLSELQAAPGGAVELKAEIKEVEDTISTFLRTRDDLLKTAKLASAFTQAKTMLYDPKFTKTMNKIPYLLPIGEKKVVDLRDGSVTQRTKDHRFTFASSVQYNGDPNQQTPHADIFFKSVMSNEIDKLEYFRTQLGYCLTGEMSSRTFFIWWGSQGCNGKGTVASLMKAIMGGFYAQISKGAAIDAGKKDAGSATPHLVPLIHARLAMLSETQADDKISEDLVKTWTGNDPIKVRMLYGEEQEVETQAKLVIQTNHKPSFSGEQAVKDRIHFVNFGARFTNSGDGPGETKSDPELVCRLQDEHLHEVFAWVLKGSIDWYKKRRLVMPKVVKDETMRYFEENDVISRWIEDNTQNGGSTPRVELYKNYKSWCDSNEETAESTRSFYAGLVMKRYSIPTGGKRNVTGLSLKGSRKE